jgi:hypothetical protein
MNWLKLVIALSIKVVLVLLGLYLFGSTLVLYQGF